MEKIFPYISKSIKNSKSKKLLFCILCVSYIIFCSSFKWPSFSFERYINKLPPPALERLARIPYIGKYFVPSIAPKDLLKKAQKSIEKARWAGAETYAPHLLEEAIKNFHLGEKYIQKKKFIWAKYVLKKSIENAVAAQKYSQTLRKEKKQKRYSKLKECQTLWERFRKKVPLKIQLEIDLSIKHLELLLEQEKFKEFDIEWTKIMDKIKKQGGKAPPS